MSRRIVGVSAAAASISLVIGVVIGSQLGGVVAQDGPVEVKLVDTTICTRITTSESSAWTAGRPLSGPTDVTPVAQVCDAFLYLPEVLIPQG